MGAEVIASWGNGGVDIEVVVDEVWVDPWSVPCKHVNVLLEMAATMHCLAVGWQPRILRTRSRDGNFTFWCKEEATAPRVCSQGLPTMAVYGE